MSEQLTPEVRLYTRPGCHLCDDVRADLEAIAREGLQFRLSDVNIEEDDELHRAFLERIPVVEVDGSEIGELEIPRAVLIARLELAASMTSNDSNC